MPYVLALNTRAAPRVYSGKLAVEWPFSIRTGEDLPAEHVLVLVCP